KLEEKLLRREEEFREKVRRRQEEMETAFNSRLEAEKLHLTTEFSSRAAAAERERLKVLEEKTALEESHAAKVRELEAAAEDRVRMERDKAGEAFHSGELHLHAREAELDKLKGALEQQHSELKLSLYRDQQGKEHELFGKLAAAREEMYQALNSHREVLDREHAERLAGLLQKETQMQNRFEEKFKAAETAIKQRLQDETEKMSVELEGSKAELTAGFKGREQTLSAAFAEKQARLEAEFQLREKNLLASQENAFEKKRLGFENAMDRREKEMDRKYADMSEKLHAQARSEKTVWESKKIETLNSERQALRSEFEKKEAILNQKLDEELTRRRTDRIRRDEEISAKKDELEKNYYAELERSRTELDKLRSELEAGMTARFRELDEQKNKLAAARLKNGGGG
ncbi:MAG: hypothetical protein AAB359_04245, partial [Elusimicrobiota bacterium]